MDTQNLDKCKGGPTKIDKEGPSKTRREENDTKRNPLGSAAANQEKTFSFFKVLGHRYKSPTTRETEGSGPGEGVGEGVNPFPEGVETKRVDKFP